MSLVDDLKEFIREEIHTALVGFKTQTDQYFQRNLTNLAYNLRDETIVHRTRLLDSNTLLDTFNKLDIHDLLLKNIGDNLQYLVSKINILDREPKLMHFIGAVPEYNELRSYCDHRFTTLSTLIYQIEASQKQYLKFIEDEQATLRKEREELIKVYGHVRDFELATTKKLELLFSQLNRPGDLQK